ncbi:MAG: tetratricopeptide repeat protein, partial [Planctomycetota bacterium]
MALRTYMRLIAILALVGILAYPAMARRGRAAGRMRGSARGGSTRAGSSGRGSFRAGRSSTRAGSFRGGSRRAGRRSASGGSFRSGSFRTGRNSARAGSFSRGSRSFSTNTRVYHTGRHSRTSTRHGAAHRRPGIARHKNYRYHGRHRRHGSYFYFSLPYYRYYWGYPYYYSARPYYYYSLPYYRYYYPYREYYQYEYHTYDYPPRTYRQRQPRPPQDSCTDDQYRTPAQQADEPPEQTQDAAEYVQPDPLMKEIADAFAARDYEKAARQANQALTYKPENAVLPFVYSQALFAGGKYSQAADVLREAVRNLDAEKEVLYPLGFYPDQDVLNDQIATLSDAAAAQPSNADLQLLLGYQLLGVARYNEALGALHKAKADYVNKEAAGILIEILEKA